MMTITTKRFKGCDNGQNQNSPCAYIRMRHYRGIIYCPSIRLPFGLKDIIMRKIELEMLETIRNQRDAVALREASRLSKTLGNTEIVTGLRQDDTVITTVYLHGNIIAQGDAFSWGFNLAGWPTAITRSRINALASHFNRPGVYTKAGKHYSGDKEVNVFDWF